MNRHTRKHTHPALFIVGLNQGVVALGTKFPNGWACIASRLEGGAHLYTQLFELGLWRSYPAKPRSFFED